MDDESPDNPTERELQKARRKQAAAKKLAAEKPFVPPPPVLPVAGPSRLRTRHLMLAASFFAVVVIPQLFLLWYLEVRAADQYASTVGFSVRTEDTSSALDVLGGLAGLSKGSSSDTNILFEFIQSQQLVDLIDKKLDLRAMYSQPKNDPIFAFDTDGTIEDLVIYWGRMVKLFYNEPAGLLELRVLAFKPGDAKRIAEEIFAQSTIMINEMSAIAQADATRYAREELELAVTRLKKTRQAITEFRNRAQIVDPNADIQGQMGLLNTLQQQLAETMIEYDLLLETARDNDPRLSQATRKIVVIEARIAEERKKFGVAPGAGGEAYSTLISEYEGLTVEREFAEQTYLAALTAYDAAQAEAQRQSRYLAAYIKPTLAERSQYPKRLTIIALTGFFLFISWSVAVLLAYAVKDRR